MHDAAQANRAESSSQGADSLQPAEATPEYAKRILAAIPPELAAIPRWICWRVAWDAARGKTTKLPVKPDHAGALAREHPADTMLDAVSLKGRGILASTDRPDGWVSMHEALDAHALGGTSGLGFVFLASEDGILGIDLDDVRDPATGELLPAAVRILESLPSAYAEVSPSLTGVKLWIRASIPGISSRPKVERDAAGEKAGLKVAIGAARLAATGELPVLELFGSKYFAATGRAIEGRSPDLSIDESERLVAVLDELAPKWRARLDPRWHEARAGIEEPSRSRAIVETKPEAQVVEVGPIGEEPPAAVMAALGKRDQAVLGTLWRGGKLHTHPSESDADWHLARLLVEGGVGDAGELKRLLRGSPRGRSRAKLARSDYLDGTVRKALAKGAKRDSSERGGSREPIISVAMPESGVEVVLSDDGIAAAFVDANHSRLRWDNHRGRWMRLERGVWEPDETNATSHEVRLWCRRIVELGIEQQEPDARTEARLRDRLGSTLRAVAVETFARRDERLSVTSALWDRDPMLVGTPEGVLDLTTGTLRAATGEEFITRRIAVAPAPDDDCPRWKQSVHEWMGGDPEKVSFLQRWCGYMLTGKTSEHAMLFNYGPPAAGKSRFLWAVSRVLGDYATTAAMETFTERAGDAHSCELAALAGARLVTASETQEGRCWSDARVKQLSGGDAITARWMRQDPFVFTPQFKLVIAGNYRPRMRNPDPAIGRRLHLLQWNHTPAVRLELDPLHEAELAGITRWMVKGCLAWIEQGLNPPAEVVEATQMYLDDEDEVGHWLAERCEIDANRTSWFTPTTTLVTDANQWRAAQGDHRAWKARDLMAPLTTRGASHSPHAVRIEGARVRGFFGVRLLGSHEVAGADASRALRIAGIPV